MSIKKFFESDAVALPKERTENDFVKYLVQAFRDYENAVKSLDPSSYIGKQIVANLTLIQQVEGDIIHAVQDYLLGQPEKAYGHIMKCIETLSGIQNLVSISISPVYWVEVVPDWGDCRRLYRMTTVKPGEALGGVTSFL